MANESLHHFKEVPKAIAITSKFDGFEYYRYYVYYELRCFVKMHILYLQGVCGCNYDLNYNREEDKCAAEHLKLVSAKVIVALGCMSKFEVY